MDQIKDKIRRALSLSNAVQKACDADALLARARALEMEAARAYASGFDAGPPSNEAAQLRACFCDIRAALKKDLAAILASSPSLASVMEDIVREGL